MAKEIRKTRRTGRWFILIIILLFVVIGLVGVYAEWGNSLANWEKKQPVVSSFFPKKKSQVPKGTHTSNLTKTQTAAEQKKLASLQRSINSKNSEISQLKGQISTLQKQMKTKKTQTASKQKAGNFANVSQMYENMDPQKAAAILSQMKDSEVVQILSQMQADTSAQILASMQPQKAAKLTTLLAASGF